jgi:hypothetical protein
MTAVTRARNSFGSNSLLEEFAAGSLSAIPAGRVRRPPASVNAERFSANPSYRHWRLVFLGMLAAQRTFVGSLRGVGIAREGRELLGVASSADRVSKIRRARSDKEPCKRRGDQLSRVRCPRGTVGGRGQGQACRCPRAAVSFLGRVVLLPWLKNCRSYDVVARFNGGANAGHTVIANGRKFAFHLLPCGLIYPHTINLLGNGVVVDLDALDEEAAPLESAGIKWKDRLLISDRAHLLCKVGFGRLHCCGR